jgi:hypothetical protein
VVLRHGIGMPAAVNDACEALRRLVENQKPAWTEDSIGLAKESFVGTNVMRELLADNEVEDAVGERGI